MADEIEKKDQANQEGSQADQEKNYIEPSKLEELKKNYIPKSKYEQMQKDYEDLQKKFMDSDVSMEDTIIDDEIDIDKEINEFFSTDMTNLEMVERMLKIRKGLIEKGHPDPFVGDSHTSSPTQADYDEAQRVADILQECVDESDGDSVVFTAQVQSRMNDKAIKLR